VPASSRTSGFTGPTLLDITPTILALFGLPVGEDMYGRVLVHAFEEPPKIERIPSWEQEPSECGMHPADLRVDPDSAQAVLNQFAALGYIAPTDDQKNAVQSAIREAKYNLARVYMDKGQPRIALPMFEDLYKEQPYQARFAQHLAQCYFSLRRISDAKQVLTELMNRPLENREQGTGDREEQTGTPDNGQVSMGNRQSSIENPRRPWAEWLMGLIHFEEDNMDQALESLLHAEQSDPRLPDLHLRIGQTYLRLKRLDDAERAFRKALDIDGDSAQAHLGLATVMLRKRQNEQAVEEALTAVSLQHFLPMGHFQLGVGLARLGHFHRATLALETAVTMVPGFANAHRWLIAINSHPGGDPVKAVEHRKLIAALIERRRAAVEQ
jgi:tetratricopeptide (TPR) repeat protein